MKIHKINNPFTSAVHHGDIISSDDYLLIDQEKRIFRRGNEIELNLKLEWPIARIISDDSFLLVDGDSLNERHNAWIVENTGVIKNSFFIGKVLDILLTKTKIIASYSKCSLNTDRYFISSHKEIQQNKSISTEGLAVFNFKGQCLFRYMSDATEQNFIPFIEVESLLKGNNEKVYLLAHLFDHNTSMLEFNLKDYSIRNILNITPLIDKNHTPIAMSLKGKSWYFIMKNYKDFNHQNINRIKSYILKLNHNSSFTLLGEAPYSHRICGKNNGSFSIPSWLNVTDKESYYIEL